MSLDLTLAVNPITQTLYWQTPNGISDWFRKNIETDISKDGSYLVTRKQIKTLLKDCELVLNDHDLVMELLPPPPLDEFIIDGEVTDEYFESIQRAANGLRLILKSFIVKPKNFAVTFFGEPHDQS